MSYRPKTLARHVSGNDHSSDFNVVSCLKLKVKLNSTFKRTLDNHCELDLKSGAGYFDATICRVLL